MLLRFSQQVVDKVDDDAWGLSAALPVGVEASSLNADSDASAATKLGLVIGLCAGGEREKRAREKNPLAFGETDN